MAAIWRDDGKGWHLAAPVGFDNEAALHDLVEQTPQLLPLAGSPAITVLGREVRLGNGYADLIAVEVSGRLVVIEVKLAYSAEARRAVISQILTYAAYLYRLGREQLEQDVLARHLADRGCTTVADAVDADFQAGDFDRGGFEQALDESLSTGLFRLVIVLDEVPPELVELVGYLEAVAENLTIDLVAVSRYDIGSSTILVPQRVDSEREVPGHSQPQPTNKSAGFIAQGAGDFLEAIASASSENQAMLRRLTNWAVDLETEGLVRLVTYHGKEGKRFTLLPRLIAGNVGLVTIWLDSSSAYLQFWRSVFERRAPKALDRVTELISPLEVRQGNATSDVSDELLAALTDAYREAAASAIDTSPHPPPAES